MSVFQAVPVNYVLTSGAGSALTWTNAVSVSSMNVSSLGASALAVSTLTTSSSVNASTLTTGLLNYSSLVGSSISTNAMTLSLTNASTQNTQIYQVATTNPTTSYTAIQASHVSTGTTNNALVLNPGGGNVGVGTTVPQATLHVQGGTLVTNPTVYNTAVAGWFIIGLWDCSAAPNAGAHLKLRVTGGNGFDNSGSPGNQMGGETTIYLNNLNNLNTTTLSNMDGIWKHEGGLVPIMQVKAVQNGSSRFQYFVYAFMNTFTQHSITAETTQGTIWTSQFTSTTDPGANSLTVRALTLSSAAVGANIGIGTTAPAAKLDVNGNVYVRQNNGTSLGGFMKSYVIPGVVGGLSIGALNGSGAELPAIYCNDSSFVGIGNTTPQYKLDVTGDVRIRGPTNGSGNSQALWIDNVDGGGVYSSYTRIRSVYEGAAGNILKLNTGHYATFLGGIVYIDNYTTNGTVTTINSVGQLNVSSDRRIKENIVYQTDTQQGLASVLNLKPATFNMIGSSGTYLGFIAQDVEQDIPLAVDGKKYEWQWEITEDDKPKFDANGDIVYKLDADGNKIVRPRGVSDRAIIATQTLAIQELAKQATSQAALVQELSKKLDATQQQLAAKSAALDALIAWAQTMGYTA